MNPLFPRYRPLTVWGITTALVLFALPATAQTVIGGDTIDTSAMLDVQASDKGVLLPRLTTAQRNAMPQPAFGLLVLNTTLQCVEINLGGPNVPAWKCLSTERGTLDLSILDTAYWNRKLNPTDTISLSARIDAKLSGYTESDPVFNTSLAKGITARDTAEWNRKLNPADTISLSSRIDAKLSGYTESDPVFNTSLAKGITALDTAYWNRKLNPADTISLSARIDTKLSGYTESDPVFNTSLAKGITAQDTAYWNRNILPPSGNDPGNILYWNGSSWTRLAPGLPGQLISLSPEGFPVWTGAALASLTTTVPTAITPSSATVGGQIASNGGANVSARGIVWGTTANPTLSASVLPLGSGNGSFSGALGGLTPNTLYYLRAYATNSAGTAYGNQQSFSTLAVAVPVLGTNSIASITQTTAIAGGNITNDGGAPVTQRGVVYGTAQNPTLANAFTQDGSGTGNFTSTLSGLTPNMTYYVRAYATNSIGTAYGNQESFVTQVPTVPSLSTREAINVTNVTATSGGSISNDGGSAVTARGVVWSTNTNPTLADNKTSDGTGPGTYPSFLTGLAAGTTYYLRAYATNSVGTGYGNQLSFTTNLISNTLPVVISISITGISTVQATLNAEVNSQGAGIITERGAVWNTTGNPTVTSNRIVSDAGVGPYALNLQGLQNSTTYYIRAYAINNYGIAYGAEITFSTSSMGLATLNTIVVTTQSTKATSWGNITDDGGSSISDKGVVWNTTGNPTLSDSKTADGAGTGPFVSHLSGLIPNTTYYIRVYAMNNSGTAYGNQITFTTSATTLTDIDGNTYSTIQIGNQVWMSENLATTRYRNGDPIPYVVGNSEWGNLTTGAWSYYNHEEVNNAIYGKLYNWYAAVDSRGVCPTGWHIPTDAEWTVLTDYLGGRNAAGNKMKATGTAYWKPSNIGATNESGFTALPSGFRHFGGSFSGLQVSAFFWSTTASDIDVVATGRALSEGYGYVNNMEDFGTAYSFKVFGTSLRCLRDN